MSEKEGVFPASGSLGLQVFSAPATGGNVLVNVESWKLGTLPGTCGWVTEIEKTFAISFGQAALDLP